MIRTNSNYYEQVAQQVFLNLGGLGRLEVMINARNASYHSNERGGVHFQYGFRGAETKYNWITITLNSMDLYDITFKRIYGGKVTNTLETKGVYCDQLIPTVERVINLAIRL